MRSRRPPRDGHPRDRQGGLAPVLLPYTAMDDDGLPLPSPLLLSQPAVQASHDNPDAPPSSESTGGDVEMEESDMVISENSATARPGAPNSGEIFFARSAVFPLTHIGPSSKWPIWARNPLRSAME